MLLQDVRSILDECDFLCASKKFDQARVSLLEEPANHPDIVRIWEMFSVREYVATTELMATNGARIARDKSWASLLRDLKRLGLKVVQLTLYGVQATHDWFAGDEGAYRDMIACAQRCTAAGLKVNWVFMLHTRNSGQLRDLYNLVGKITPVPERLAPQIFSYAGRARRCEHLRPTWGHIEELNLDADVVQTMSRIYKAEKEWVTLARNDLLGTEQVFPDGMVPLVIDGEMNVYVAWVNPLFRLGVLRDGLTSLYDVYVQDNFPGAQYLHSAGFSELGRMHGDPESEGLHTFTSVWTKWVYNASRLVPL